MTDRISGRFCRFNITSIRCATYSTSKLESGYQVVGSLGEGYKASWPGADLDSEWQQIVCIERVRVRVNPRFLYTLSGGGNKRLLRSQVPISSYP